MAIELTDRAAREFKRILSEQGLCARTCLRIAVRAGGCSGFTYVLDFASDIAESDTTFESRAVRIVCDPKSCLYLDGVTVDFRDGLLDRGFVFDNPNARAHCSCGVSFAV